MKKLVLLLSLAVFAATGAFAQTTPASDQCSQGGTDTSVGQGPNSTFTTPNSFTISIPAPTTSFTFSAVAGQTDNDQGVTGLVVREYLGGDEISCFGRGDGVIAAYVVGGTAPYTFTLYREAGATDVLVATSPSVPGSCTGGTCSGNFEFNGGTGGNFATLLTTGQYYVNVIDANGCAISSLTAPTFTGGAVGTGYTAALITLEQPDALQVTYCQTPDLCLASTGQIQLSITGGTQPYALTWAAGTYNGTTAPGGVAPAAQAGSITAGTVTSATSPTLVGTTPATAQNVMDAAAPGDLATETENTQTVPQPVTISNLTGSYNYNFSVNDANNCPIVQ